MLFLEIQMQFRSFWIHWNSWSKTKGWCFMAGSSWKIIFIWSHPCAICPKKFMISNFSRPEASLIFLKRIILLHCCSSSGLSRKNIRNIRNINSGSKAAIRKRSLIRKYQIKSLTPFITIQSGVDMSQIRHTADIPSILITTMIVVNCRLRSLDFKILQGRWMTLPAGESV